MDDITSSCRHRQPQWRYCIHLACTDIVTSQCYHNDIPVQYSNNYFFCFLALGIGDALGTRIIIVTKEYSLQCFDTVGVGWATRRASGLQKNWVLVCWWHFDWSIAHLISAVVSSTSITFSSNKIPNEDIPVLANPGPPGKMAIKTERVTRMTLSRAHTST